MKAKVKPRAPVVRRALNPSWHTCGVPAAKQMSAAARLLTEWQAENDEAERRLLARAQTTNALND